MKNLAKLLSILAAVLFSCALCAPPAQATSIQGDIDLGGEVVTFPFGSLSGATSVVQWISQNFQPFSSTVTGSTGDFGGISAGTLAAMATPWVFYPSTMTPNLWSVGGFNYFLSSATIVTQTANSLHITGIGTVSGNGFDPTQATWDFQVTGPAGTPGNWLYIANTTAIPSNGVADGGWTIALMFGSIALLIGFGKGFLVQPAATFTDSDDES